MPRLLDVARAAGVSTATASRVFNARHGVSPELRRAVLAAAGELGYAPLSRRAPTSVVGVIVPELENPVFASFAQQLTIALRQVGCTPVLGTETASGILEDEWIEMLLGLEATGIVVVSGMHADTHASPERYERLRARGVGLVLVNGYVRGLDAAFVSADDRAAMARAMEHLAALGHRTVGLAVGPERYVPVIRKREGFEHAARSLGVEALVETTMFTFEGGAAATARLLERGATAVVCASDVMALGAIGASHAASLDVPADLSVVGFDDSAIAPFAGPPLTTLRQPVDRMSKAAVRLLTGELKNGSAPAQEFLFRPELIVRASTGAAPALRVEEGRRSRRRPRKSAGDEGS